MFNKQLDVALREETIRLPNIRKFYDTAEFENAIEQVQFSSPTSDISKVTIVIGSNCKFMADVTLKLLCLCHHVVSLNIPLTLQFNGGQCNCFTFLERCGFFRTLPASANVIPARPDGHDTSVVYAGNSVNLLEIREVSPSSDEISKNRPIPRQLTDALGTLIKTDCEKFLTEIQTVVSEFCDNVPEHSAATTPGFVYMHHYPKTGKVLISVADIGVGLLNSLRAGLTDLGHPLRAAADEALILEMFNKGLSRKGEMRGSGLNRAATIAIQYKGSLHVRLDRHVIDLHPAGDRFATALINENCSLSKGTHITFSFSTENIN